MPMDRYIKKIRYVFKIYFERLLPHTVLKENTTNGNRNSKFIFRLI